MTENLRRTDQCHRTVADLRHRLSVNRVEAITAIREDPPGPQAWRGAGPADGAHRVAPLSITEPSRPQASHGRSDTTRGEHLRRGVQPQLVPPSPDEARGADPAKRPEAKSRCRQKMLTQARMRGFSVNDGQLASTVSAAIATCRSGVLMGFRRPDAGERCQGKVGARRGKAGHICRSQVEVAAVNTLTQVLPVHASVALITRQAWIRRLVDHALYRTCQQSFKVLVLDALYQQCSVIHLPPQVSGVRPQ